MLHMKPLAFPLLTASVITGLPGITVHPFDQFSVEHLLFSSDFLLFLLSGCLLEVFSVCRQGAIVCCHGRFKFSQRVEERGNVLSTQNENSVKPYQIVRDIWEALTCS